MTPIVMDKDGKVRPFQVGDLKEVVERDKRIAQLERLNATLAAQVDRQAKVVDAASQWARDDKGLLRIRLRTAIIDYEAEMDELAKGSDNGIPTR